MVYLLSIHPRHRLHRFISKHKSQIRPSSGPLHASQEDRARARSPSTNAKPPFTSNTKRRWWYFSLASFTLALTGWKYASTSMGWAQERLSVFPISVAVYDRTPPSAPFQHIVAYVAGVLLFKRPGTMMIPKGRVWVALVVGLSLSLAAQLQFADGGSLEAIFQTFTIQPSLFGAGINTIIYAIWTTCSFIGISVPLVSLFSQCSFAARSWGGISGCSYACRWVHMVPVIVLSRLIVGYHHQSHRRRPSTGWRSGGMDDWDYCRWCGGRAWWRGRAG
jgi:hypothetical protein